MSTVGTNGGDGGGAKEQFIKWFLLIVRQQVTLRSD